MRTPSTPFPTSGYYGEKYFCDRETEATTLLQNLENGLSVTIISIRRMGKTGLIQHIRHKKENEYTFIYLDILHTESLNGLLNALATGIVRSVPETSKPGKKIWKMIKSLRPVFSFDQFTGMPQIAIDVSPDDAKRDIADLLKVLENHPQKVIIAIDEFQQILDYPEKNTDAWLRGLVQQLNNVHFIFSGSRQHLMTNIFMDPKRPFYRSTQLLKLHNIPTEAYKAFISGHFKKKKRKISDEVIDEMLHWTRRHTYYVQLLCSKVFMTKEKEITTSCWQQEAHKLLEEQKPVFFEYRQLLTKGQWDLLKAIAMEEAVYAPTAGAFISKHQLGSSAAVLRALNALLDKELVYYEFNEEGQKYYQVYDLLLCRWMQQMGVGV